MRTHSVLKSLLPAILVMASLVVPARPALAASVSGNLWVSAQSGNDANSGLSSSSPFRTIQAAARIAGPGATIHILPGVYRETVTPVYDGTSSARITYVAENGPGTVKIRGSVPSASLAWTRLSSNTIGLPSSVNPANVYYADLSSWGLTQAPRFIVQMNSSGDVASRLTLAREPDSQISTQWKYSEFWWAADGGSAPSTCNPVGNSNPNCDSASRSTTQLTDRTTDSQPSGIQPGNLTTLGSLTGATLFALDTVEGHYYYQRKIIAHNVAAGTITVDRAAVFDAGQPGLGWGTKYYVENLPSLLDTAGEFWYDTGSKRLYLWPPASGSPASQAIEISRAGSGLLLGNRSYTTFDGLTLELFNGTAVVQTTDSSHHAYANTLQRMVLRYANQGIHLGQGADGPSSNVTDGFTLQNSTVAHMDTRALDTDFWWSGGTADTFVHSGIVNTAIRNNDLYDLGFRSDVDNAEGVVFKYPDKVRFEGNHVHQVAHNGVWFGRSLIQSTKSRDFSPSEIKIGNILVQGNTFEQTCLLAADCGGLKFWGNPPDQHVFRDVLVTGNIFRNIFGWASVAQQRGRWSGGSGSDVQGMGGFGFYTDGASGIHAYRNISYNNGWSGFEIYNLWWDGDLVVYDNIAANSLIGISLWGPAQSSFNTQVANNILINNEGYGIRIHQPPAGYGNFVLDRNRYFNDGWRSSSNGGVWQAGDMSMTNPNAYYPALKDIRANTPWEEHGVQGDPAFSMYVSTDHSLSDGSSPGFHLTASSTNAIDRGTLGLPTTLTNLLSAFGISEPVWILVPMSAVRR